MELKMCGKTLCKVSPLSPKISEIMRSCEKMEKSFRHRNPTISCNKPPISHNIPPKIFICIYHDINFVSPRRINY